MLLEGIFWVFSVSLINRLSVKCVIFYHKNTSVRKRNHKCFKLESDKGRKARRWKKVTFTLAHDFENVAQWKLNFKLFYLCNVIALSSTFLWCFSSLSFTFESQLPWSDVAKQYCKITKIPICVIILHDNLLVIFSLKLTKSPYKRKNNRAEKKNSIIYYITHDTGSRDLKKKWCCWIILC